MKIAFFVDSLPPNTDGVAHTFTKLAESLYKNNDDYRFFSPFVPETNFPWLGKVDKVPWVSLFLYPHYRIGLPVLKKIENELDQFKPDIVHASSPTLLGKTALTYAKKIGFRWFPVIILISFLILNTITPKLPKIWVGPT